MARHKAPAQTAPQTLEDATCLLDRYALLAAGLEQLKADANAAVAAIRAEADNRATAFAIEMKAIFNQLKPWWAVAGTELTDGKRKSIELGGCLIGQRMSTPRLSFDGDDREAIGRLETAGWDDLIRTKVELDKPAILKLLASDQADFITALGFSAKQREEFFIDRIVPKAPATVEVADPAGEAA